MLGSPFLYIFPPQTESWHVFRCVIRIVFAVGVVHLGDKQHSELCVYQPSNISVDSMGLFAIMGVGAGGEK